MDWQEVIVLAIVVMAAMFLFWRFFGFSLCLTLSNVLLRRGKVKWAMRLRSFTQNRCNK